MSLADEVHKAINNKQFTRSVMINPEKAFDLVRYQGLLYNTIQDEATRPPRQCAQVRQGLLEGPVNRSSQILRSQGYSCRSLGVRQSPSLAPGFYQIDRQSFQAISAHNNRIQFVQWQSCKQRA